MDPNKVNRVALRKTLDRLPELPEEVKDQILSLPEEVLLRLDISFRSLNILEKSIKQESPIRIIKETDLPGLGITVATAETLHQDYETAVFDMSGPIPVARYVNEEHAEAGHEHWVEQMKLCPETLKLLPIAAGLPHTARMHQVVYKGMVEQQEADDAD